MTCKGALKHEKDADHFFDYHSMVHYEFDPSGKIVNQAYYMEVL
jgi:hypothetical protein